MQLEAKVQKYNPPAVGKIKYYQSIIKNDMVVASFHHSDGCTFFGKVWENEFGGGGSMNKIIPRIVDYSGVCVIKEDEYNNLCKESIVGKKVILIESHYSLQPGVTVKIKRCGAFGDGIKVGCEYNGDLSSLPYNFYVNASKLDLSKYRK